MKFLDEAKVYIRSGDGGNGCVSFRREKFIEFGGPNGGDGGKRRRRGRRSGRRPQHADRLSLSAAFHCQERPRRHGQGPPWRQRRRRRAQGAGRHADLRRGRRDAARRSRPSSASASCSPRGGNGGFGNAHFKSLDQPRAAPRQSRPARRGAHDPAAAQADRRCRHRRPAERRQIDVPRRGQRGQAEDRRLSLHHAAARSSASSRSTAANSCWPIFPA